METELRRVRESLIFVSDVRPWPWAASVAYTNASSCDERDAPATVRRDDLERWLGDPGRPPSLDEMASVFGLAFDPPDADAPPAERLRFTFAVLRDAFPDDGAVRRWLRAPGAERGGELPLDLLLSGRVERLEELAVLAWNRRRLDGGA